LSADYVLREPEKLSKTGYGQYPIQVIRESQRRSFASWRQRGLWPQYFTSSE